MINKYETIIILDDLLDEKQYKESVARYSKQISGYGGKICEIDRMGKKKLAYPIKKKTREANEGWYVLFTYKSKAGDVVPDLEKYMREDEKVLKFLTVRRDDIDDYDTEVDTDEDDSPTEIIPESEQQPDALDVLLGFAKYK